jgi:hypothetical protein
VLELVFIVGSLGLVKVVHVELPDERGEVIVLEEPGEDGL